MRPLFVFAKTHSPDEAQRNAGVRGYDQPAAILILTRNPAISAWMPKSSVHGWQSMRLHKA
jgi:hypothetical protein